MTSTESKKHKPYYSVVIPVYNEEGNAGALYEEVKEEVERLGKSYEIIFVDDASRDKTLEELKEKSPITIVRMRRNSGQSSALDAGIRQASGTILITMDGDGQDDPANIPALLQKLEEGYDAVCAWRHKRKDSFVKRTLSWGWKVLRTRFVNDGVHDAGTQFRVYKRDVFDEIELYGERHRFIPALLKWQGFAVDEVKVNHRPRLHGTSKYNWRRPFKGIADIMYMWFWHKYSYRPQQLFGVSGLFSILFGSFILLMLAYARFFHSYYLSNKIWPLVGFFFVMVGIQLFSTGILAANLVEMNSKKKYFVAEVVKK